MNLDKIKKYLKSKININFIKLYDNSRFHNHTEKGLTHLQLTIVSNDFLNHKIINRHRMIFLMLSEVLKKNIYSLTLNTYTSNEWKYKQCKINNDSKCLKRK